MSDLNDQRGFWWFPESPERKFAGHLVSHDDFFKLIVTDDDLPPSFALSGEMHDVLHGITSSGKNLTLLGCLETNGSWSSNSVSTREFMPSYILEGALITATPTFPAFTRVTAKWPALMPWFWRSGLTTTAPEGRPQEFSLSYSRLEPITFDYADGVSLELAWGPDRAPFLMYPGTPFEFQEVAWVSILSDRPRSLVDLMALLDELKDFFSIVAQERRPPTTISLELSRPPSGSRNADLPLHLRQLQPRAGRNPNHPVQFLLRYRDLEDELPAVLRGWHAIASGLGSVRSLYATALYGSPQYVDTSFLSLAQAVEVAHRILHGGTYVDPEYFAKEIEPLLVRAIPSELGRDFRKSIQTRIHFMNAYSLRTRIKSLWREHEPVLSPHYPNMESVIGDIVNARNYYTHYSAPADQSPGIEDLLRFRNILHILVDLAFMTSSGVSVNLLHSAAARCETYKRLLRV